MIIEEIIVGEVPPLSVSEFVALLNQTLEYAYPSVTVTGELANFRVSKNKWVYFDLKDENSSVKCFGTVYQLPGPLEDGMLLTVRAQPRLHQLYGFSLNVISMQPTGEGTIRRAAELLQAKLTAEGLFDEDRKRALPYPPCRIGLITSSESAAYADFIKIISARWAGLEIELIDVQVQGDAAPAQIVSAIDRFNGQAEPPDVLVITRGGGSAEDLQAFSHEQVTRAVAASRVPTLVAIGHEVDISLAELAADQRASTPSNAAEMLVPDRQHVLMQLTDYRRQLHRGLDDLVADTKQRVKDWQTDLQQYMLQRLKFEQSSLAGKAQLLSVLNPEAVLRRGYAIVRKDGTIVRAASSLKRGERLSIQFHDAIMTATVDGKIKE